MLKSQDIASRADLLANDSQLKPITNWLAFYNRIFRPYVLEGPSAGTTQKRQMPRPTQSRKLGKSPPSPQL